jgi:archaellum component FlaC
MPRLLSFRYSPRVIDGWSSPRNDFGKIITVVSGSNGSGKTPVMKGIMHALGHDISLPPDIVERCSETEVRVEREGSEYTFTRSLRDAFRLSVHSTSEGTTEFVDEKGYSNWFMGFLGASTPRLTTKARAATDLYVSILFPMLWVDQDHGWTSTYWTPGNKDFVLDQRQEMVRFLLGLPERHPFRTRTDYDEGKTELARLQRTIELQRSIVEDLRRESQPQSASLDELTGRRAELQAQLRASETALGAMRSSTAHFDAEVRRLEEEKNLAETRLVSVNRHRVQLELALKQIDGEVEVLTANVQATDLLRQFCQSTDCKLFSWSEESYGRTLLFMKDQIKDLKATDSTLSQESNSLQQAVASRLNSLEAKHEERRTSFESSPARQIALSIDSITRALAETELQLARLGQYMREQERFEKLLVANEQLAEKVAQLRPKPGKRQSSAISDARALLGNRMDEWLTTLRIQNVKRGVIFTEEWVPLVGGEPFTSTSHQSGSTRARVALAFHAALLEVALEMGGHHPGWLLLDAPKQHELDREDLRAYVDRLRSLDDKYPRRVQAILSIADTSLPLPSDTTVWRPTFGDSEGARYLG